MIVPFWQIKCLLNSVSHGTMRHEKILVLSHGLDKVYVKNRVYAIA